eukprot:SAG22_NODE_21652_length_255_cov_0.666667_1_plen_49_part_00
MHNQLVPTAAWDRTCSAILALATLATLAASLSVCSGACLRSHIHHDNR